MGCLFGSPPPRCKEVHGSRWPVELQAPLLKLLHQSGVCLSIGLLVEGFGHIIYNIIYYNMIKAWGLRQGFDQD